jgi:hypothetical protein
VPSLTSLAHREDVLQRLINWNLFIWALKIIRVIVWAIRFGLCIIDLCQIFPVFSLIIFLSSYVHLYVYIWLLTREEILSRMVINLGLHLPMTNIFRVTIRLTVLGRSFDLFSLSFRSFMDRRIWIGGRRLIFICRSTYFLSWFVNNFVIYLLLIPFAVSSTSSWSFIWIEKLGLSFDGVCGHFILQVRDCDVISERKCLLSLF